MDAFALTLQFLAFKNLLAKLEGALVGGSYARGDADRGSDIDLFVIYKDRFASEFEAIHSREVVYKKHSISLIFQSRKNILSNLTNPDPSVISFLREGVIIFDPKNNLQKWIKRARRIKIFKDNRWRQESIRRLQERINYNVGKINLAVRKKDLVLATYLLRGIVDEIVEKLRMYDEDWLYSQRKSNIMYLLKKIPTNKKITKIFYSANSPLDKHTLRRVTQSLKDIRIN